ncbi:conserved exported protein of unknown function [Pseudorhizobium banfieldiae]|uniref:Uncharacterized protein n=1 Tax=Pseudorhizobium banfieldiae TaxID=1125847 RepID=L0NBX4_9HYPH|nr:hypothetical protein [Pseudorhizobium banfieldiae]CAD6602179.1 hypothetical protein RNT25_01055 [arsenite-oxidising bacterium NT-25]CAD6606625.1 hypothetical protein RTCK_01897 [Rhizobium sp. TCK]CCF18384.1 conserved exported protein of unknown function [Pseudorhizobium banfieldiae]
MTHALSRRAVSLAHLILATTAMATAVPLAASAAGANVLDQIAAVKAATIRFADVDVALAEGYIRDPMDHCVTAAAEGLPAELGAMGIHYIHPQRLGITAAEPRVDGNGLHTDFLKPSILLYEPQADGSLKLVGVENLIFEASWKAAGNSDAPVFAGRSWDRMADDPQTPADEAHGFQAHFDQHVWIVENPAGPLMPFNPEITCEHHHNKHGS